MNFLRTGTQGLEMMHALFGPTVTLYLMIINDHGAYAYNLQGEQQTHHCLSLF